MLKRMRLKYLPLEYHNREIEKIDDMIVEIY